MESNVLTWTSANGKVLPRLLCVLSLLLLRDLRLLWILFLPLHRLLGGWTPRLLPEGEDTTAPILIASMASSRVSMVLEVDGAMVARRSMRFLRGIVHPVVMR